jgi:hypothetical protein
MMMIRWQWPWWRQIPSILIIFNFITLQLLLIIYLLQLFIHFLLLHCSMCLGELPLKRTKLKHFEHTFVSVQVAWNLFARDGTSWDVDNCPTLLFYHLRSRRSGSAAPDRTLHGISINEYHERRQNVGKRLAQVTRLGEFSPLGRLLSLNSFSKSKKGAPILG